LPRIPPSLHGGSATADRVLTLLTAFRSGDTHLTLAELSSRTGLYKSTALRLLSSLEAAGLVVSSGQNGYVLGGEIMRLQAIMANSGFLERAVIPILRQLVLDTRETAALHVRRGDHRIRLYTVDSPQPLREHIVSGEELPLDLGAGGMVLRAFADGGKGPLQAVRRQGYALSIGERIPELSGISAPVFDAAGKLVGALTLTMPTQRWKASLRRFVVLRAAQLTSALGGTTLAGGRGNAPGDGQKR
jgi:DNA-binding IclR family transcriptional regulator